MFTSITITVSQDIRGNQYTSIRRYDNHGKMGYTGNHCGEGRIYQSGNVERIVSAIRSMGYHHMHGHTYGKLLVS